MPPASHRWPGAAGPDLPDVLTRAVALIRSLEDRIGMQLFNDFLALYFSSARPPEEIWTAHPVIVAVVDEPTRAKDRGVVPSDVDPFYGGVFFLSGLYALLLTLPGAGAVRDDVLARYVETTLRGMQVGR